MASTYDEAREALSGLAVTSWNTVTSNAPLFFDNLNAERPKKPTHFGRLHIRHFASSIASLGGTTKRWRRNGRMYVQVFDPVGTGMNKLDETAEGLVIAFENAGGIGNVWFRGVSAREIGSDGDYRQVNVEVDFTWDRTS